MALNFNWQRLDEASATAVTELINAKLNAFVEGHNTKAGKKEAPLLLSDVAIATLDWGPASPYLEVQSLRPALDFGQGTTGSSGGGSGGASSPGGGAASTSGLSGSPGLRTSGTGGSDRQQRGGQAERRGSHASGGSRFTSSPNVGGGSTSTADFGGDVQTPSSTPNPTPRGEVDSLAPFLGESGLYVQCHLTYAGTLRIEATAAVTKTVHLGPKSAVSVSLPFHFEITNCKLDVLLNINLHQNLCRFWLEPTALEPFLGDLAIVATIGSPDPHESSFEESDSVLVDERAVAELVTAELRAIIKHKIMSPHFVSIPVRIGGAPNSAGSGSNGGGSTPQTDDSGARHS